jgi:hypothetical protein
MVTVMDAQLGLGCAEMYIIGSRILSPMFHPASMQAHPSPYSELSVVLLQYVRKASSGAMKVIASIEDPVVIMQILDHLKPKAEAGEPRVLPESRAPPVGLQSGLFD